MPTGSGKTLPMVGASLGTGKIGILIMPLLTLEQRIEKALQSFDVSYINLTNTQSLELEMKLKEETPEVIITSVEALGDKARREVLCRSDIEIGHVGWDEAVVRLPIVIT